MTPVCERLTIREEQVLRLWRLRDKEIAYELGISRRTVDTHMRSVFKKLNVTDRREAAAMAGLFVDVA